MGEKKVIIIGAGIAGLSAGCYLQMNGYETKVFELHNIPGGLCTAWKRKGYTFDACIHWLVGSSPSNSFHKIWKELGALKGKQILDYDVFTTVEYEEGKLFTVYTDVSKLEAEMNRVAPEDASAIKEFIDIIRTLSKVDVPIEKAPELFNMADIAKMMFKSFAFIKTMGKYGKVTTSEYAKRFKSPVLNKNFGQLFGLDDEFPVGALLMMLSWMDVRCAGYPIGGSLEFAKSIEKTYLNLGGSVSYNSKVKDVLVEDNKAVGISLENGEIHNADIIVSAADGHYTIFEMLKGKYVNQQILDDYKNMKLFTPIIQVSLGVARSFHGTPHSIKFPLNKSIKIDDKNTVDSLGVRIYNFDPTLAPQGSTSITSYIETDYDYWMNLKNEAPERYREEKDRIACEVIEALDKKFGDIKGKVDVYDVATPYSYVRYTNNWKASWEGWKFTTESYGKRMKKTLPGLENFYMIGQWVEPGGGLPSGATSGRNVTQIICKKDKKKFKTTING